MTDHTASSDRSGAGAGAATATGDGPARRPRRLDAAAPLAGVFYLAVAGLFIAGAVRGRPVGDPMVVAGVVLVLMGVLGIVRALLKAQRRSRH
ncbi:hypothetical protein DZF91_13345 [Actinomadura logoneensis]|uniref:Uncharacterized protein n=1 Tax=Actinomadura logoneensis TaxID=2293572 RepID=A0A372JMJ4_9ACTN|nr:hypothetical protein [Actinomadura logoneensis]RFU41159.1 hypothetical protein DZF91_13345 [Actinomadura logoneensis]